MAAERQRDARKLQASLSKRVNTCMKSFSRQNLLNAMPLYDFLLS
jgi:hypothetical protein